MKYCGLYSSNDLELKMMVSLNLQNFKVPQNPKQGKSEGFDSCDPPSNLTQIGFKSSIFQLVWPSNLMDDPEKQSDTSSILL